MRDLLPSLACILMLSACGPAVGSNHQPPKASPWIATAVGRIDTQEEARHLVAAVDGVIAHIKVSRGDHVKAGQPLVEIDCAPRAAETRVRRAEAGLARQAVFTAASGTIADLAIAQADIDSATAVLANDTQQLQRAIEIYNRGFLSRGAFDAKVQAKASSFAQLHAAEARLGDLKGGRRPAQLAEARAAAFAAQQQAATAQTVTEQCTVKSPITGQVLQILRREGEFSGASQGSPVLVVGDLSQLVVRAEINERDAALIYRGQAAEVWIDGNKSRWRGSVTHLAAIMGRRSARSLDPTDRFDRDTREVFIRFEGKTPPALVGLRVTVGLMK